MSLDIDIYSEVVWSETASVDRFFLAPRGLGIAEAKRQRQGRYYKTREQARRGLVAHIDRQRRTQRR